ncbi:MAG: (d)CMP kinase [Candidatus Omnitrophota bacterium]
MSKASLKESSSRLDGRLFYERHKDKPLKNNERKTYYDEYELPEYTNETRSWGDLFGRNTEKAIRGHKVVFVKEDLGDMWTYDRDVIGDRWDALTHARKEFMDGEEVSAKQERLSISPREEASKLARRQGVFFRNGEELFKKKSRFNPIVWSAYKEKGFDGAVEYFRIQFTQHDKNNAIYNFFTEPRERGTVKPFLTTLTVGAMLITALVPVLLLAVTKAFSLRSRRTKTGFSIPIFGKPIKALAGGILGFLLRQVSRFSKAGVSARIDYPKRDISPDLRAKIAKITPQFCAVEPFVQYLAGLYEEDAKTLLDRFYPRGTEERAWADAEIARKGYRGNALKEEMILRPINVFFWNIVFNQSQELKSKGQRGFLFTDWYFRQYMKVCLRDGVDPVVKFDFNQYLPKMRAALDSNNFGVIKSALASNDNISKNIVPGLKDFLEQNGVRRTDYPISRGPISIMVWGGLSLVLGLSTVLSMGTIPLAGSLFAVFVSGLISYELWQVMPFLKFHLVEWPQAWLKIYQHSRNYTGDENAPEIQKKVYFWKRYAAWWAGSNIALAAVCGFYLAGALPFFGLIIAGLIYLINVRVSMRSWWYLLLEANRVAMDKDWNVIRSYKDIGKDKVMEISKDKFLKAAYLKLLVGVDENGEDSGRGTLRKYSMVTKEEAAALVDALRNGRLPALGNWRARKMITEFFNKIELYKIDKSKGLTLDVIKENLDKFPAFYIQILADSEKVLPAAGELDSKIKDVIMQKEVNEVESPFSMIKGRFSEEWKIYLEDLLAPLGKDAAKKAIRGLVKPGLSFEETVKILAGYLGQDIKDVENKLIREWIAYRTVNLYKTVDSLYDSARLAFEVFLEGVLGREPTQKEIEKYLTFILKYTSTSKSDFNQEYMTNPEWTVDKPSHKTVVTDNYGYFLFVKPQAWSFSHHMIEIMNAQKGVDNAVIMSGDWEHLAFPTDFFLLPFDVYDAGTNEKFGVRLNRLVVEDEGITPTNRDQTIAENNWNIRMIPSESDIAIVSHYGPGMFSAKAVRDGLIYASNIEDSAFGNETAKDYDNDFSPRVTLRRGREKVQGYMSAFVNRFPGLVLDDFLSPRFQELLESDGLHWTEKAGLVMNYDHYFNEPVTLRYNLLIFLFAFFLPFTPFAYLSLPLLFLGLQFLFAQSITTGGIRAFMEDTKEEQHWWKRGIAGYMVRFWSLIFTFLPFTAVNDVKARESLKGLVSKFSRGQKDTSHPIVPFAALMETFHPAIKWGAILLLIFMFSPVHPLGIVGQFFFFLFPFAFIFGPFMKNAPSNSFMVGIVFGGGIALLAVNAWLIPFMSTGLLLSIVGSVVFGVGLTGKERYTKGITHGVLAVFYYIFWRLPLAKPIQRLIGWRINAFVENKLLKDFTIGLKRKIHEKEKEGLMQSWNATKQTLYEHPDFLMSPKSGGYFWWEIEDYLKTVEKNLGDTLNSWLDGIRPGLETVKKQLNEENSKKEKDQKKIKSLEDSKKDLEDTLRLLIEYLEHRLQVVRQDLQKESDPKRKDDLESFEQNLQKKLQTLRVQAGNKDSTLSSNQNLDRESMELIKRISGKENEFYRRNLAILKNLLLEIGSMEKVHDVLYYGKKPILKFGTNPVEFEKVLMVIKDMPQCFKSLFYTYEYKEFIDQIVGESDSIEKFSELLYSEEYLKEVLLKNVFDSHEAELYDRHGAVVSVELVPNDTYARVINALHEVRQRKVRLEDNTEEKSIKPPKGLNISLVGRAFKEKKIDLNSIKDQNLKAFLSFLKKNELGNIIVMGGAVRDIFFDEFVNDIDLTVKVKLNTIEKYDFIRTTSQVTPRVYDLAMQELKKLSEVLKVEVEDFLKPAIDPDAPIFRGLKIQYAGPIKLETLPWNPRAESENYVYLKRFIIDSVSRLGFSSNTGASLLQMGIDYEGNLYGHIESLNDLLKGRVRLAGDGMNFTIGDTLRLLRLKHQFGLEISEYDYKLLKKTITLQPLVVANSFMSKVQTEVIKNQVKIILSKAQNPKSAQEELKELGVFDLTGGTTLSSNEALSVFQSSGIKMKVVDPDMNEDVVMYAGYADDIASVLNDMNSGIGDRFLKVLNKAFDKYPQLKRGNIMIKLLSNSRDLMKILGPDTIGVDIAIFKPNELDYEFEQLFSLEIEEELRHMVDILSYQGHAPPLKYQVRMAIRADYSKLKHFLSCAPRERFEILKALIGDNRIDDRKFYLTLVKSLTKRELGQIIEFFEYDSFIQRKLALSPIITELTAIQERQPDAPLSNYDLFKLAIKYAWTQDMYKGGLSEFFEHPADNEIYLSILSDDPGEYIKALEMFIARSSVDDARLKEIVENSLMAAEDEVRMAIIFALPQKAISDNIRRVIEQHQPSIIDKEASLRKAVKAIEAVFDSSRTGKIKTWGRIIITSTEEMTPLYAAYLKKLEGVLYPEGMAVEVLDGRHLNIDFKCGNGGATQSVLKYLESQYGMRVFDEPILMLHAGGFGVRLPESLAEGTKALTRIPLLLPNGETSTSLAESIRNTYIIADKMRNLGIGGVYITNCDGFFVYNPENVNINPAGINVFTAPIGVERVIGKLGVAHDVDGRIDEFREKDSRSVIADSFKDYRPYLDTGMLPANTANYLLPASKVAPLILMWDILRHEKKEIDTAGEILIPMAANMTTVDKYINLKRKTDKGFDKRGEAFFVKAYNLARSLGSCYNSYVGPTGLYEDIGDSEVYLDSKTDTLSRIFDWQNMLNSKVGKGVNNEGFLTDASIDGDGRIGEDSWIIGAYLSDPDIGRGCLVYDGVGSLIKNLRLNDKESLTRIGVKGDGNERLSVAILRRINESPKETRILGRSVVEMCKLAGTYRELELIAEGARMNTSEVTLWDAPLWPVMSSGSDIQELLGWMSKGGSPSAAYLASQKVSINWARIHYDYGYSIEKIGGVDRGSLASNAALDFKGLGKGLIITLEGLARAGKSTVADKVARRLGGYYFNKGDIYVAWTKLALDKGINLENEKEVLDLIENSDLAVQGVKITLNGQDIRGISRTSRIMQNVSKISQRTGVIQLRRESLINKIKSELARKVPLVVTGRRGPLPGSFIDIFITISLEEAAKRSLADRGAALTADNIREEMEAIRIRNQNDSADFRAPGVIEVENEDLEQTVQKVMDMIDRKVEDYITRINSNRGYLVEGHALNEYYEPKRRDSVWLHKNDLLFLMESSAAMLSNGLDAGNTGDAIDLYLLKMARRYWFKEIKGRGTLEDIFPAVLGIVNVVPYAVDQIPKDDAVNVFMARDAGLYFSAHRMLAEAEGRPANDFMFHLSRKNMLHTYKPIKKLIETLFRVPGITKDAFDEKLLEEFIGMMREDKGFREEAMVFYTQLREAGIVSDKNFKYRFIDSWSAGTMLYFLQCLVIFFSRYDIDAEGNIMSRPASNPVETSVFAMSSKDYVSEQKEWKAGKLTYKDANKWYYAERFIDLDPKGRRYRIPTVDWRKSGITRDTIKRWYTIHGLRPPPIETDKELFVYLQLMGAQINLKHNPFGAFNAGHRIDWSENDQRLHESSPAKLLGAGLMELLLGNSVLNFISEREGGSAVDTDVDVGGYTPPENIAIQNSDFLNKLGITLTPKESRLFDKIILHNAIHFYTANDSIRIIMLMNLAVLIKFIGAESMKIVLGEASHYDFQGVFHEIKAVPPVLFRASLNQLVDGGRDLETVRQEFGSSMDSFKEKLLAIIKSNAEQKEKFRREQEEIGLNHKKYGVLMDIDGTILLSDQDEVPGYIVDRMAILLRNGIPVALNTGRPYKGAEKVLLNALRNKLGAEYGELSRRIYVYSENSNNGYREDGKPLYESSGFDEGQKKSLLKIFGELGLGIASEKPYKFVVIPPQGETSYDTRDRLVQLISQYGLSGLDIEIGKIIDERDLVEIVVTRKEKGLEDFKRRVGEDVGVEIKDEKIFIAGDSLFGNDASILSKKGAYVSKNSPAKIGYLLDNSIFIRQDGRSFRLMESGTLASNEAAVPMSESEISETMRTLTEKVRNGEPFTADDLLAWNAVREDSKVSLRVDSDFMSLYRKFGLAENGAKGHLAKLKTWNDAFVWAKTLQQLRDRGILNVTDADLAAVEFGPGQDPALPIALYYAGFKGTDYILDIDPGVKSKITGHLKGVIDFNMDFIINDIFSFINNPGRKFNLVIANHFFDDVYIGLYAQAHGVRVWEDIFLAPDKGKAARLEALAEDKADGRYSNQINKEIIQKLPNILEDGAVLVIKQYPAGGPCVSGQTEHINYEREVMERLFETLRQIPGMKEAPFSEQDIEGGSPSGKFPGSYRVFVYEKAELASNEVLSEFKHGGRVISLKLHPRHAPTEHTALLIDALTEVLRPGESFLDWGTGEGTVSIWLKDKISGGVALDINDTWLNLARENFKLNGVQNIEVRKNVSSSGVSNSLFTGAEGEKFDVIGANTPQGFYVPEEQDPEDPIAVLRAGGKDGRYFVDGLIRQASDYLKPGGRLVIVHNEYAGIEKTLALMRENGFEPRVLIRQRVKEGEGDFIWKNKRYIEDVLGWHFETDGSGEHIFYDRAAIVGTLNPNLSLASNAGLGKERVYSNEKELLDSVDGIAKEINKSRGRVCVYLSGTTNSGKSDKVAPMLQKALLAMGRRAAILEGDRYFKPGSMRPKIEGKWVDHPDALYVDWIREDVSLLLEGAEADLPADGFMYGDASARHSGKKIKLGPEDILIIDSLFAFDDEMLKLAGNNPSVRVFVDAPEKIRFDRRIARLTLRGETREEVVESWDHAVKYGEDNFIYPSRDKADFVLLFNPSELERGVRDGWNRVWIEGGQFEITPEQRVRMYKRRELDGYVISLFPRENRVRDPFWKSLSRPELRQPIKGFNFYNVVNERNALIYGLELGGNKWNVIVNAAPAEDYHSMIVPDGLEGQYLEYKDIPAFIDAVDKTTANIFYNSLYAGASVNSKHLQIYLSKAPVFQEVERGEYQTLEKRGNVDFIRPNNYSGNIIIMKGGTKEEKILNLAAMVYVLQRNNIPFNISGMGDAIAVIPRSQENAPSIDNKPCGAPEAVKRFVVISEESFLNCTPQKLSQAIKEITLSNADFDLFLKESFAVLDETHNLSDMAVKMRATLASGETFLKRLINAKRDRKIHDRKLFGLVHNIAEVMDGSSALSLSFDDYDLKIRPEITDLLSMAQDDDVSQEKLAIKAVSTAIDIVLDNYNAMYDNNLIAALHQLRINMSPYDFNKIEPLTAELKNIHSLSYEQYALLRTIIFLRPMETYKDALPKAETSPLEKKTKVRRLMQMVKVNDSLGSNQNLFIGRKKKALSFVNNFVVSAAFLISLLIGMPVHGQVREEIVTPTQGQREVLKTAIDSLKNRISPDNEIYPLLSRLSPEDVMIYKTLDPAKKDSIRVGHYVIATGKLWILDSRLEDWDMGAPMETIVHELHHASVPDTLLDRLFKEETMNVIHDLASGKINIEYATEEEKYKKLGRIVSARVDSMLEERVIRKTEEDLGPWWGLRYETNEDGGYEINMYTSARNPSKEEIAGAWRVNLSRALEKERGKPEPDSALIAAIESKLAKYEDSDAGDVLFILIPGAIGLLAAGYYLNRLRIKNKSETLGSNMFLDVLSGQLSDIKEFYLDNYLWLSAVSILFFKYLKKPVMRMAENLGAAIKESGTGLRRLLIPSALAAGLMALAAPLGIAAYKIPMFIINNADRILYAAGVMSLGAIAGFLIYASYKNRHTIKENIEGVDVKGKVEILKLIMDQFTGWIYSKRPDNRLPREQGNDGINDKITSFRRTAACN